MKVRLRVLDYGLEVSVMDDEGYEDSDNIFWDDVAKKLKPYLEELKDEHD